MMRSETSGWIGPPAFWWQMSGRGSYHDAVTFAKGYIREEIIEVCGYANVVPHRAQLKKWSDDFRSNRDVKMTGSSLVRFEREEELLSFRGRLRDCTRQSQSQTWARPRTWLADLGGR